MQFLFFIDPFETMARKVGELSKQEIISAMTGLSGKPARAMAEQLAGIYGITWQSIYRMTAHVRWSGRKPRSDRGFTRYELRPGTDIWNAAELVVAQKMLPEQAYEYLYYQNQDADLPHLQTFTDILRKAGLGAKQRKNQIGAHRRFEGKYPGHIFQCDVTALKVRWQDERTRRILRIEGIDKNHPMEDPDMLRVWQIMILDDFSRRRFLRYVTTRAISSTEMVRFLCEAYAVLGIPHILYTDNGSEFKGKHTWAAALLNDLLIARGGYKHMPHAPNNAKATGKVETAHKWAENIDRWVGLAVDKGRVITVSDLNRFADRQCDRYNYSVRRHLKCSPMDRWSQRADHRIVDRCILEAALLSEQIDLILSNALTFEIKGEIYQLPRTNDFINFHGRKIRVVVPQHLELLHITLPNRYGKFEPTHGGQFTVPKARASSDAAEEYRRIPDTSAEKLTKQLKASWKEKLKTEKHLEKQTGLITPVPYIDVDMPLPGSGKYLPAAVDELIEAEISAVLPFPVIPDDQVENSVSGSEVEPEPYQAAAMGYWRAVAEYSHKFESIDDAKQCLLGLFPDMTGEYPAVDIEDFIARAERSHLKAVS